MSNIRILAFSDVHGRIDAVERLVKDVKQRKIHFDVIIVAGDIGNPQRSKAFMNILKKIAEFQKLVLYVKGNWDVNISYEHINNVSDLDEIGPIEINNFTIVGHGRKSKPYGEVRDNKNIILVTHYPPYGILDKGRKLEAPLNTLHSGLIEVNYLVDFYKPIIHIFGHSHSFGGIDFPFNGVVYVNVSRLDRITKSGFHIGNYCVITVEDNRKARIEWFYLNGTWKKCANCGRKTHLPVNWRICRKCSRRREMKIDKIPEFYQRIKINVKLVNCNKVVEDFAELEVKIPVKTIKDNEVLHDFIDIVITKELKKLLHTHHHIVVKVPKEKIIETYGEKSDGILVPFSEYLFSCNEKLYGEKLCALMKLYSVDKRVHVFWGISNTSSGKRIDREYVFFTKKILDKIGEDALDKLLDKGFTPLVFERFYIKQK
ncbi:MAG: metallophosphoesterase family protein [Thermoproteales archaeon]|nr:metallophosphoesterase family protein [Thermoproteales archaeon]